MPLFIRQHPSALSNITFVFMLYWLNVMHEVLLRLSSLVNCYDSHSSKRTLLLVLISWWQIGIFRFNISISLTYRGDLHGSVIPSACNLTFAKTLSVLWPIEILGLQHRHTCKPRNIIGIDEQRRFDYFFWRSRVRTKYDCRQNLVTSVMSARKENSSGRPSAYADTLEVGYVEESQKV